jgi:hypothetical protein
VLDIVSGEYRCWHEKPQCIVRSGEYFYLGVVCQAVTGYVVGRLDCMTELLDVV